MSGTLSVVFFVAFAAILLLSIYAQIGVHVIYNKYSKIGTTYTGAQTAGMILRGNGIYGISVIPGGGKLSDHYNSKEQTVTLSSEVYSTNSISSVCIAAHELGHVLQDQEGFSFLLLKQKLVPVTYIANYASYILILLGYLFSSLNLYKIGVIAFFLLVVYQLVTLPVEFNASSRAVAQIRRHRILTEEELSMGKKVLFFAALTYIAAFLTTLLHFLRLLLQLIISSRRSNDD